MATLTQTITPQALAALASNRPAIEAGVGFKMPDPDHRSYATVMAHVCKITPPNRITDWRYPRMELQVTARAALDALDAGDDAVFIVITAQGRVQMVRYEYADDGGIEAERVWDFGTDTAVGMFLEEHQIAMIAG
ncbi:MAG: hypothetical protein IPM61_16690 [Chlorobi bacterium]|nr:hypothetical protein [Chlorobiota bacterium]